MSVVWAEGAFRGGMTALFWMANYDVGAAVAGEGGVGGEGERGEKNVERLTNRAKVFCVLQKLEIVILALVVVL